MLGDHTLLFGLPMLAKATSNHTIEVFSGFHRSGSLVFGGGHAVLPLLQQAVVPRGWDQQRRFSRRLRRGASRSQPALHFCRLFGDGDEVGAKWLDWRPHLPHGDLPAILPPSHRRAALLGRPTSSHGGANSAQRRQCDKLSAFCSGRFIRRSGRVRSSRRRIIMNQVAKSSSNNSPNNSRTLSLAAASALIPAGVAR
jgi:hypothetical protein